MVEYWNIGRIHYGEGLRIAVLLIVRIENFYRKEHRELRDKRSIPHSQNKAFRN